MNLVNFKNDFFHLFIYFFSITETGPWQKVLDKTLEDSRNQEDPLPLKAFNFNFVTAKYVKFKLLSYWGNGGGLQYFNLKKSGICIINCIHVPLLKSK